MVLFVDCLGYCTADDLQYNLSTVFEKHSIVLTQARKENDELSQMKELVRQQDEAYKASEREDVKRQRMIKEQEQALREMEEARVKRELEEQRRRDVSLLVL